MGSSRRSADRGGAGLLGPLRQLMISQNGSIAVYVSLTLPIFVGAAGLAVDVASWYRAKRTTQVAADAAAYAAALELARQGLNGTPDMTDMEAAAIDAAGRNGVGAPLAVNNPPASGLGAGDPQSVEVIVNEPAALYFTTLFLDAAPQIQARAVAKAVVSDACIWALHPTARGAFSVAGTADVNLSCGVVVNSDHPEAALEQTGSSCLTATAVSVHGGYSGSCVNPEPEVFTPSYGDPFAHLEPPTYGSCDYPNKVTVDAAFARQFGGGPVPLGPGVYCGGIEIKANQTVIFDPGLYVLKGGVFYIAGNAHVSNDEDGNGGVTFYLTGTGGNYARLVFESGADIVLTPTTSGALANVLFYQDPAAPSSGTNRIAGGANMDITGIIYIPSQHVEFTGGSSTDGADVLIAASTITFTGNTHLNAGYAGSLLPETYYVRLVE
jgi:hypothetical protein